MSSFDEISDRRKLDILLKLHLRGFHSVCEMQGKEAGAVPCSVESLVKNNKRSDALVKMEREWYELGEKITELKAKLDPYYQ